MVGVLIASFLGGVAGCGKGVCQDYGSEPRYVFLFPSYRVGACLNVCRGGKSSKYCLCTLLFYSCCPFARILALLSLFWCACLLFSSVSTCVLAWWIGAAACGCSRFDSSSRPPSKDVLGRATWTVSASHQQSWVSWFAGSELLCSLQSSSIQEQHITMSNGYRESVQSVMFVSPDCLRVLKKPPSVAKKTCDWWQKVEGGARTPCIFIFETLSTDSTTVYATIRCCTQRRRTCRTSLKRMKLQHSRILCALCRSCTLAKAAFWLQTSLQVEILNSQLSLSCIQ